IGSMQNWFPHLPVQPYPSLAKLPQILSSYDWFFVVQNATDEFVLRLICEAKKKCRERIKVLYFYPSKHIIHEPYYSDCFTNPALSIAENLQLFCQNILHLPKIVQTNGFTPLPGLIYRKKEKRVVIHPTSAKIARNW